MGNTGSNVVVARVLAGLSFIGLGVLAFLGAIEVIDFLKVWSYLWPVLIILAGMLIWLANRSNWLWALIVGGIGLVALVNTYTDFEFNVWTLVWPVIMIAIGLSIIANGDKSSRARSGELSSDHSDQFALLSGAEHRVTSKNYQGGKATAVMGGVELDLRDAIIKKQAVLEVFVLMGGVEVKVPAGVMVKSDAGVILGGVEARSDAKAGKDAPLLLLTGTIVMGGVEVK